MANQYVTLLNGGKDNNNAGSGWCQLAFLEFDSSWVIAPVGKDNKDEPQSSDSTTQAIIKSQLIVAVVRLDVPGGSLPPTFSGELWYAGEVMPLPEPTLLRCLNSLLGTSNEDFFGSAAKGYQDFKTRVVYEGKPLFYQMAAENSSRILNELMMPEGVVTRIVSMRHQIRIMRVSSKEFAHINLLPNESGNKRTRWQIFLPSSGEEKRKALEIDNLGSARDEGLTITKSQARKKLAQLALSHSRVVAVKWGVIDTPQGESEWVRVIVLE